MSMANDLRPPPTAGASDIAHWHELQAAEAERIADRASSRMEAAFHHAEANVHRAKARVLRGSSTAR